MTTTSGTPVEVRHCVVMDMKKVRPACVLLQAAMGGDSSIVTDLFVSESWLLAPTDDMRLVPMTREEWAKVAAVVNKEHRRK